MRSEFSKTSMSATIMSTSDHEPPFSSPGDPSGGSSDAALALGKEIERFANQLFSGGVTVAPRLGPSALNVGGGGASPAVTAPPVPGPLKQPPLAVAPLPKESDLRALPAMLSDTLALSPVALATTPDLANTDPPYFLAGAGLPAEAPLPGAAPPSPTPPAGGGPRPSSAPVPAPAAPSSAPAPQTQLGGAAATPTAADPWSVPVIPADGSNGIESWGGPSMSAGSPPPSPYFLDLAGLPAAGVPPANGPSAAGAPFEPALPGVPGAPSRPSVPLSVPSMAAAVPIHSPGAPSQDGEPRAAVPAISPYAFHPELVAAPTSPGGIFDARTIKQDFPILRESVHGKPIVWLDNAATTQKPRAVIDRLSYYYEHENSNVHRAAHALAARATDAYEAARDTVRRFLNAPSAQEIVFLRGTTEAINLVAKSWGRRNVGKDDEIVITWLEHHANIVPWQQLCAETGACLRVAPVDSRGQVILEDYERLLGPRTRLVSISQVSNALGTIVPVRPMIEMAHRHGALTVVDGAQAVSHMRVDVQALDCDFYCFSGHKIFAPTGIGVLYGKRDILNTMPPWQGGGNMISDVTFEKTTYQPAPARFEAGTGSIADAVGLGAALDYVTSLGQENVSRYEHDLLVYATDGLARVPGLRMIGTAREKAGVLSFVLDGIRTEDVGAALDQEGIAVRSGHHCAQPILRRFGLESTVRASLAPYNTCEDIDALVAALLRIQTGRPLVTL
jgi:cysteine desulfurase / selenocysteine lyase